RNGKAQGGSGFWVADGCLQLIRRIKRMGKKKNGTLMTRIFMIIADSEWKGQTPYWGVSKCPFAGVRAANQPEPQFFY
ncbi:MAG: hypothetical protein ACP5F3_08205, partial [Candidatus Syntrophosphaera sp.]